MPVNIGSKPGGDFSNPIELLADCHRRIERFLNALRMVVRDAGGGKMTGQQKRDWQQALDYFQNAAPRHTADEEDSLFPRLREIDQERVQQTLAEVTHLEADHDEANRLHATVDTIGRRWLRHGVLAREETEQLIKALEALFGLYEHHIAVEENTVFPVAASVLQESEKREMGAEMARRRGLDPQRIAETLAQLGEPVK